MIRKPNKAVLRNHFATKENAMTPDDFDVCVVDGGALLHKVNWPKTTYSAVLDRYETHMKRRYEKYNNVKVVFDGYSDEKSTKSQEHLRRMGTTSASIQIKENTKVTCNSEAFLANQSNKDQLIKLMCTRLEAAGFATVQCHGDADTLIVKTGLEFAERGRTVVTMAADTDILVLLMSHWRKGMGEMIFGTEIKVKNKMSKLRYWRISDLLAENHPETLLFAHAWTGCDTTSAIHQKGKPFFI